MSASEDIVLTPDPRLSEMCVPIEKIDDSVRKLAKHMLDFMYDADGCGLAAPQIGKSIRVVVIDLDVLKEDFPEYEGFRHAFIKSKIAQFFNWGGKNCIFHHY